MTIETCTSSETNVRSLLFPYMLTVVTAMVAIQIAIASTGGRITLLAGILTALVAVGMCAWFMRNYRRLTHIRFGFVIAHAVSFLAVTTSFNTHAVIRTCMLAMKNGGFDLAAHEFLATPWFGATLVMSSLWGMGLLLHIAGSILGRGWEG